MLNPMLEPEDNSSEKLANPAGISPKHFSSQQNLLAGTNWYHYLRFLFMLLYWVAGWFTVSVVVFLRRDFGERYLSWPNLYAGYSVVFLFAFVGNAAFAAVSQTGFSGLMIAFYLFFIGLSFYHRFIIWRRRQQGVLWYSFYEGTSHIEALIDLLPQEFPAQLKPSDAVIKTWIEPLILGLVGFALSQIDPATGSWLILCAIAFFIRERIEYWNTWQQVLNQIDGIIQGQFMHAALKGAPPEATQGFTLPAAAAKLLDVAAMQPNASRYLQSEIAQAYDVQAPAGATFSGWQPPQADEPPAIGEAPTARPVSFYDGLSEQELAMLHRKDDNESEI